MEELNNKSINIIVNLKHIVVKSNISIHALKNDENFSSYLSNFVEHNQSSIKRLKEYIKEEFSGGSVDLSDQQVGLLLLLIDFSKTGQREQKIAVIILISAYSHICPNYNELLVDDGVINIDSEELLQAYGVDKKISMAIVSGIANVSRKEQADEMPVEVKKKIAALLQKEPKLAEKNSLMVIKISGDKVELVDRAKVDEDLGNGTYKRVSDICKNRALDDDDRATHPTHLTIN